MKTLSLLALFCLFGVAPFVAFAYDPNPLQDICPADNATGIFVNGFPCKDPQLAAPEDFFLSGLDIPGNTSNEVGSAVTPATVLQIPGLNTMGVSLVRIDFAPNGGLNPPHHHPRATEILVLLEGTLYVGFVTSNPENRLFAKILYPGDVYVFPIGLIHFQLNIANVSAVAFSGLNSQNPGVITTADAVFGSDPPIDPEVLITAFQLHPDLVKRLQHIFAPVAAPGSAA